MPTHCRRRASSYDASLPSVTAPCRIRSRSCLLVLAMTLLALIQSACGGSSSTDATARTGPRPLARETILPGTGRPPITVGDKNFTEQFLLGELYAKALRAKGFTVLLNQNIGPTQVTIQAMQSGSVDMYPEYLGTWDSSVAGFTQTFSSARAAYSAAQEYAIAHGLELLNPTPFSDTEAIAVTFNYGVANRLSTIGDLAKVASTLTLGAAPEFQQQSPGGLPAVEQAYSFMPETFKALEIGDQYQALDQGTVQAAVINTTDGALVSGNYTLLGDPKGVFGWGNVVPVVTARALQTEGPAFATTVNKVSSLLTTSTMRQLNAAVDVSHEDPDTAATQFLSEHGLLAPKQS